MLQIELESRGYRSSTDSHQVTVVERIQETSHLVLTRTLLNYISELSSPQAAITLLQYNKTGTVRIKKHRLLILGETSLLCCIEL